MENILYKALKILIIALTIILIPILVIEIIGASHLPFDFSQNGITNLFKLYSNTFTVLTALFAVVTIYIALGNLINANAQYAQAVENNLLNNFYKHQEMFNKFITRSTIIKQFSKDAEIPAAYSLMTSYNYYYYKNFRDFVPEVNSEVHKLKDEYQKLTDQISTDWNENDPSKIDYNIISEFFTKHPSIISEQIKYLIDGQKKAVSVYWKNENAVGNREYNPATAVMNFETFSIYYWSLCFFNDVMIFDSKTPINKDDVDYIYDTLKSGNGIQ